MDGIGFFIYMYARCTVNRESLYGNSKNLLTKICVIV